MRIYRGQPNTIHTSLSLTLSVFREHNSPSGNNYFGWYFLINKLVGDFEIIIRLLKQTIKSGLPECYPPLKVQIGQFFKVLLNFYKKSREFWTILDLRKYPIFGPFLKRFPLSIGQKSSKFSARFARQFS